jgi:hypothetical protein
MAYQAPKRKRGRPTKAEMEQEAKRFPFNTVSWYGKHFTIPISPALIAWAQKYGQV